MKTTLFKVYISSAFICAAACTLRANTILWYNGDLASGGGGTVNEQSTSIGVAFVYDDFTVTDPAGWIVDSVWSNDAMKVTGISQAFWSIRSGMSVGNGGSVVSSGIGSASQTPTGRVNPSLGFYEYTVQLSGLNIYLPPGTYWLSVAPLVGTDSGGVHDSYISATTGANAIGTPPGNDGNSLFYDPSLGYNYRSGFLGDYSMGVGGSAVPDGTSTTVLLLFSVGIINIYLAVFNPKNAA